MKEPAQAAKQRAPYSALLDAFCNRMPIASQFLCFGGSLRVLRKRLTESLLWVSLLPAEFLVQKWVNCHRGLLLLDCLDRALECTGESGFMQSCGSARVDGFA